ncbi:hypothetical protein [Hamadaea tsunoensis]|uniref:hypothetical protein n=1 Tax=Hamadaea tsunoensis TaxID=53368 RepID=UPI0004144A0E|nr:hypothetical protein [Hamadaea tsunoensis]
MRHVGSFLLAVILAPVVYLLTGLGLSAFQQATAPGSGHRPIAIVLALATLAVGGIVYAILVMARLSPVGPALAGCAFLAAPAWPLVDRASYDSTLNDIGARFVNVLGVQIIGLDQVGSTGIGVLLAVPLIATLASARRWSRYPDRAARVAYAPPPVYAPPAYLQPPQYQQPPQYPQPYAYPAYADPPEAVTEPLPDVAPPTLHYPPTQEQPPADKPTVPETDPKG